MDQQKSQLTEAFAMQCEEDKGQLRVEISKGFNEKLLEQKEKGG